MSTSGTQSPPLEATGEQGLMGASSVDGATHGIKSDNEQRGDYLKDPAQKNQGVGAQAKGEILSEDRPHRK